MKSFRKISVLLILALVFSLLLQETDFDFLRMTEAEAATFKMSVSALTLEVGETYTLTVNGSKKKFTWTSSDKKIATVSRNKSAKYKAKVTAVAAGTSIITAKRGSKKCTCTVTVKRKNTNNNVTSTPTTTPTPTAAPKSSASSQDPYELLGTDGEYKEFYIYETKMGHTIYSVPGYTVGYLRNYNDTATEYTEHEFTDKNSKKLDTDFISHYDSSNRSNFISVEFPGMTGGDIYELEDIAGSYDLNMAIFHDSWYPSDTVGCAATYSRKQLPHFLKLCVQCLYNTDKISAVYFYVFLRDEMGEFHEIEGLRVQPAEGNTSTVITTPTPTPTPTATPTPTPSPTPTPDPEVTCDRCSGSGREACHTCDGTGGKTCPYCYGGRNLCSVCGGLGKVYAYWGYNSCTTCKHTGYVECRHCNGTGTLACETCGGAKTTTCSKCGGKGTVTAGTTVTNTNNTSGTGNTKKLCEHCLGTGFGTCLLCGGYGGHTCTICHGDGEYLCSLCNGYGKTNGLYGYSLCNACDGTGYIRCTAHGCHGTGFVECVNCGGDGITVCEYCGGWGEY